ALAHASEFDEAAVELDRLIPDSEGGELCEALLIRARSAFWLGDTARAGAFADQAAQLAEELNDEQLEALVASFFTVLRSAEGRVEEALRLAEDAVAVWVPGSH